MTADPLLIAIDGPSASGKSTVSRRVAQRLNYIYVDSGSLYRGVTWKVVHEGVDVNDAERVVSLTQDAVWEFMVEDNALVFRVDGEDPGEQIRSEPVREGVSYIAAIPEIRSFIVERLRESQKFGDVVMEGRDIGSVVFPDTPYKFYLDADPEERARRRHMEIVEAEGKGDVESVYESLRRRDRMDRSRKTAPLQIPLGATIINSTGMSIDDVVEKIVRAIGQEPPREAPERR